MKKITFTLIFICLATIVFGQGDPGSGQVQLPNLNGVTFGFGVGYSHTFDKTYDYSLTTDVNHNLVLQPLSRQSFVISSVIMVKLGKLAVDPVNNTLLKQSKKPQYREYVTKKYEYQLLETTKQVDILRKKFNLSPKDIQAKKSLDDSESQLNDLKTMKSEATGTPFWSRLSIDVALDLANVAPNVSFNKNVNGGLGLGYFITDNLQAALFYDVSRVRQLRDYVRTTYESKPIPNGSGTNYNALDTNDNNLFYDKTISGLSFKLIFSLANKASTQSTGD
jgi:ribosomal protein S15P/S13E